MSEPRGIFSLSPGFAAQFEPDGDAYVYRKSWKGAAVLVSAAERNAFVAAFNRSVALQLLGLIAGLAAVIIMPIRFAFARGPGTVIWVVIGASVLSAILVTVTLAAWGAPARALAGRAAVAPPLSASDARRAQWTKTPWGQVVFPGLWAMFLASRGLERASPVAPWVWFSMAAMLFLAAAGVAWLKWRAGKTADA